MRILRSSCLVLSVTLCGVASAQELIHATMYKMPYCTCCEGHAEHLQANGFDVEIEEVEDLAPSGTRKACPQTWKAATRS
jgi:hypothetical protein